MNICIAGLNRRAGYATDTDTTLLVKTCELHAEVLIANVITAVPIEAFPKMFISSFPNVEESI